MNKLINTTLFLFTAFFAWATPADSLQKANQLYAGEAYEAAINSYENIIDSGYESAALYYNLGNAYFKSNQPTRAILNYERARLLDPSNEDILFNLELANQFVVDKIEALPQPFFVKWFETMADLLKSDEWAVISIGSFILMLILAALYLFSRVQTVRKTGFMLAVFMLVLALFSFSMARKQYLQTIDHQHAIIFTPTVTVKASPAESGTDLFVIHEGLKVTISDELNEWYEIRLEDGNSGWVKQSVLQII
ncbi:SH3 domain-containing protein [Roseimarinus sediminis]|uniref:SH3 domain-containing protein n=1 Tax=Roseimarinus sediminis TaxID=1610899 RepID=UPI003D1A5F23